jgi:hypothetical protein
MEDKVEDNIYITAGSGEIVQAFAWALAPKTRRHPGRKIPSMLAMETFLLKNTTAFRNSTK